MTRFADRRSDERGFTLMEVLLVVGITAAILVPVMAWSVMALGRTANSDIDADTTAFIQLSRFLDADVSGSFGGSDIPKGSIPSDCQPSPASSVATGSTELRLLSGSRTSPTVTTYAIINTGEQDAAGRTVSQLVRRTCSAGAPADKETVVAEQLVGDAVVKPVVVSCEDRASRGSDDCGQVSMQVQGVYGDPVTVRAARRVDPDPDPSLGRRPIAIMECEPDCPATVYREDTIRFDGTLSSDPDPGGGITYYRWDFGDGSSPVEGNPAQAGAVTHAYSQLGEFRVVLTVGNDKGNTATAEAVITVRNAAPIAVATPNPVNSTRREAIQFDASQSVDPDQGAGEGPTYEWNFGDGSTASGVTPSPHQYLMIGSYIATLTVTDRDGSATTISIPVTVTNRPPVAKMVTNPPSVPCSATDPAAGQCIRVQDFPFAFSATAIDPANSSLDVDGSIAAGGYLWDIRRTAEGSASMFTRTSPTLNYTFTQNGKYRVTLEVTDNDGAKTVTVVEVTVNKPPAAVISPATGCVFNLPPFTCEFDGSASADDDGEIVSYLWDFGDGTTSSEISPTKTWPNNLGYGTFQVTLTVVDNDGTSSVASVPIKVNRPPTAAIGPSTLDVYRKKVFTFEGLGSADLDGTVSSYEWDWGDGTAPETTTSPTIGKIFQTKGTFTVRLTVTDNDGGRGTVTRQVTVKNQPPVAWINTPTGPIVNEPAPFSIRLAGWPFSEDPDGAIVNYHWDFGDGTSTDATADEVTHTYPTFGTYDVRLTVRDDDDVEVTSDPVTVKVNHRPVAAFTTNPSDPYSLTVPFAVGFDASSSSDQDGTIQTYTWDFGDGSPLATGVTASHTYTVRGSYTVTLTVDDGEGGVATLTKTALVGINQLPTASIVVSPTQLFSNDPSATWTFNGAGSSDPDGTIVSYAWNFGDGHTGSGSSVSHTFTTADCAANTPASRCTVRLTVTDNRGSTATTTVVVKMNRAPTASITGAEPLRAGRGVPFNPVGGLSGDVDGSVNLFEWDWGDGSALQQTTSSSPPHTYAANGDYTLRLRVRDDNFVWSAWVQKQVRVENSPPTARIVPTPGFAYGSTVVSNSTSFVLSLSGATSTDPDGSIASYAWDFGDGTTGTGAVVSHTFTDAGCAGNTPLPTACTVTLTVTDDSGLTHSTSIRVRMNQLPVAVITPVSGVPCAPTPPCTVTLTSADSYDPDPGGSLSTARTWGVNGSYAGNQTTLTRTFSTPGTYSITVAVVDNDNQQRTATYVIQVNSPPTAGFSMTPANGVINVEPYSISFNGTGAGNSSDSDGSIATYSWDFGDGSPLGSGPTPSHTYAAAGTYQVRLTVTDNRGATATITKPVKANAAPVAAIGPATLDPKLNLPFAFSGTGSVDSDGTIATYAWDFGDGATATGASPSHTYTSNGPRTVTLTVTDNDGRSNTVQRTLTVAPNVAPTAAFTMDPSGRIDDVPTEVDFDATGSSDADGSIVSYAWDFGDGGTGTGSTPSHTYSTYGPRTITLTVTDNNGQTATTSQQLLVNERPVAVIETSPNPPVLNDTPYTVDFFALRSEDQDGAIVSYSWDFGDGSPDATGDAASHTFPDFGNYAVTLTVTDNNGATGTATTAVKVNRAPVPVMTYSPSDVRRQATVQFDGSGSSDPDGTVAVYQWDFGDGTGAGGASASHVYTSMGTFTATLTVTDENGRSASTSRTVEVGNANPVASIDTSPSPPKVDRGSAISFIGSNSYDPDGTIASYEWDYGDGATAAGANPTAHVFAEYGTYNATLTITDNQGLTDQTSIVVTISPPPDPTIGPTTGITRGIPFQFTSSGTSDPNGSIVSYYWDFGDGTTATGPSPIKTYSTATGLGPFTVTLVVTDDAGRQVSVTKQITLLNQNPMASVSAIRLKQGVPSGAPAGPAPLDIQFFGSASGDPDGTIAEYRWNFGDGSPVTTTASDSVTHTYTGSPRTVTATLTVVDNNGGTNSRTIQITVSPNQLPVASFTISPPAPYAANTPLTATANAAASADPDGYIATYDWDFDTAGNFGGDTATGVTATHAYSNGYYTARLTVTDNSNGTATTTRTVHIPGSLPAPSGLRQVSGSTFAWNPVPGAVAYKVYTSRTGGDFWACLFRDQSNPSATVDAPTTQVTLSGGCGTYDVRVQARNLDPTDWGVPSGAINAEW